MRRGGGEEGTDGEGRRGGEGRGGVSSGTRVLETLGHTNKEVLKVCIRGVNGPCSSATSAIHARTPTNCQTSCPYQLI